MATRGNILYNREKNYQEGKAPDQKGFVLSGTTPEKEGALQGLEFARTGYGQDIFETGSDIQRVKELQRQRTEGYDPVSEAIRNQKAGNMASIAREMKSQGVKGGAVAGALDEVSRRQDADIAASMYGQQGQNIDKERSLASNMLAGTTSLMQGEKAGGTSSSMPKAPESSGFTVICTELYEQGYYSKAMYDMDAEYGRWIRANKPEIYAGYILWAVPTVKLMKKSKIFSKLIATIAVPWAMNIAGETNKIGAVTSLIGEPICGLIGKVISIIGVKYVKN
jgi:hypothetical protein